MCAGAIELIPGLAQSGFSGATGLFDALADLNAQGLLVQAAVGEGFMQSLHFTAQGLTVGQVPKLSLELTQLAFRAALIARQPGHCGCLAQCDREVLLLATPV